MPKARRLSDIRARAAEETARLRAEIEAREDFTLPRPKSWRGEILLLIAQGKSLQASARAVGVSRSGLRHAREIDPTFAATFDAAHSKGLRARFLTKGDQKRSPQLNDKIERFNDKKPSSERLHCNLGSAKLTRKRCDFLAGAAPAAFALPWRKSLISPPSGRMARAL